MFEDFLVGGLEHESYFSIQLGISSFQLTFTPSFFRGFFQSPTRLDIKYLTNTMIWRWDENNFHHTAGV
jgi:hypothetical protein